MCVCDSDPCRLQLRWYLAFTEFEGDPNQVCQVFIYDRLYQDFDYVTQKFHRIKLHPNKTPSISMHLIYEQGFSGFA